MGGLFYTGSWHQEREQLLAAAWIVCFTAAMTAAVLFAVKFVCRGLRENDDVAVIGDLAIHGEEVYPAETFAERVSAMSASAAAHDPFGLRDPFEIPHDGTREPVGVGGGASP